MCLSAADDETADHETAGDETAEDETAGDETRNVMNRNFLHREVIGIIGGTAGILMAAVFTGFPLAAAVLPGLVLLSGIAYRKGYSPRQLFSFSWSGIKRNLNVALLLVFIGIILPSWHLSGTIEHLNKLFLSFIRPEYIFTTAFLSGAVMSLIIGSAIGSLSIVGLPVMAAAEVFGLPVPLIAGALVSGAFVGDRTSPLSSAFQLLS